MRTRSVVSLILLVCICLVAVPAFALADDKCGFCASEAAIAKSIHCDHCKAQTPGCPKCEALAKSVVKLRRAAL